eukprot:GEMP01040802.1.p1 GENE.GEMP01040802.1~~GEMP01040802.1.p1  ORF type:complete len:180 (+),score=30.71 GEMP01040802.1:433-972(+)
MFKGFTVEDVSGQNQVKGSVQKDIRRKLLDTYPRIEKVLDTIWPKKDSMMLVKCKDHVEIVSVNGVPLFFKQRDGHWCPTLRVAHKYPSLLPKVRTDTGAIKFVLKGANVMCPGFTSAGGRMETVGKGMPVQIVAEGKEHAMAIGMTTMSTDDITKINKGVGVENLNYLNDGLWKMLTI